MTDVEKRRKVIRVLTCAANHADEGMISLSVDEVREIVELLREQEPRVLTPREFDEVRLSKPVWLEVRNMDLLEPALFRYQRPEYGKVAFSLIDNRAIERDVTEYYWGWRCWSAEPGDEQRGRTMYSMTDEYIKVVRREEEIADGLGQAFSPD